MAKMKWDQIGERFYETGIEQGALYPQQADGTYTGGEPWNGLISVTESPSGAETTPLYANNAKYLELQSAEDFGFSIEAYIYPDGFAACNGELEATDGVTIGQQARTPFGMVYKTFLGNDVKGNDFGYKLTLIYGAKASPSENANTSVNDSPEAKTMSWECTTTPLTIEGYKKASKIVINSTKANAAKLAELEAILYGSEESEDAPRLPLPAEVIALMKPAA